MTDHNTTEQVAKPLDFGDYCNIEQKRYGVPNEIYLHKVVGRIRSNSWVDVPVDAAIGGKVEVIHKTDGKLESVLLCICCGVDETLVRRYRESDCKRTKRGANE